VQTLSGKSLVIIIVVASERTRARNYGTRYNRSYMYFVNWCVVEKKNIELKIIGEVWDLE
jgi:hypothetical protein